MARYEFSKLERGDIIRHVRGVDAYVVDANYGSKVVAVRTVLLMNPSASEWEKYVPWKPTDIQKSVDKAAIAKPSKFRMVMACLFRRRK